MQLRDQRPPWAVQPNLEAQYSNQEFHGLPKEALSVAQHKLLEWTAKGSWGISCRKTRAELLRVESGSVGRSSWKSRESRGNNRGRRSLGRVLAQQAQSRGCGPIPRTTQMWRLTLCPSTGGNKTQVSEVQGHPPVYR